MLSLLLFICVLLCVPAGAVAPKNIAKTQAGAMTAAEFTRIAPEVRREAGGGGEGEEEEEEDEKGRLR